MRADAGTVRLCSAVTRGPTRRALHRRLAYVPGDVTLWPNLSGGEVIDLLGRMRGGLDRQRRADLLERFDLDPRKKGRAYSKGNRQKVALVAALASDVELLLLDEPTSGLDPLMEEVFREVIGEEQRRGDRTVLLSSHILSEVEALCDRVTIIRDGRSVETGTLAELRHLTRTSIAGRAGRSRATGWPACPACTTCRRGATAGALRRRQRPSWTRCCGSLTAVGRTQPGQPAAHAGGTVPAALRPDRHRRRHSGRLHRVHRVHRRTGDGGAAMSAAGPRRTHRGPRGRASRAVARRHLGCVSSLSTADKRMVHQ